MRAYAWAAPASPPAEVDVVDGFLLVLSPWAVRNLAFEEALWAGHGFDFDFCQKARAAGRKVMTADLRVIQHRSLELVSDLELWTESHVAVAQSWDQRLAGTELDEEGWKRRARRAEAEREAARAVAYSRRLLGDARIAEAEAALTAAIHTRSWKLTEPLRRLNHWRRRRAQAGDAGRE